MFTILCDSDNVITDFVGHVLDTAFETFGRQVFRQEVKRWDLFSCLGLSAEEVDILKEAISQPGWCASMPVLPDAQQFVKDLRKLGAVYAVTSPWNSPTWAFERVDALRHHFKISADHVVSTPAKELVVGDVLIDDRASHIRKWARAHPTGLAILFAQPFNEHEELTESNTARAHGYAEVLELIRQQQERVIAA